MTLNRLVPLNAFIAVWSVALILTTTNIMYTRSWLTLLCMFPIAMLAIYTGLAAAARMSADTDTTANLTSDAAAFRGAARISGLTGMMAIVLIYDRQFGISDGFEMDDSRSVIYDAVSGIIQLFFGFFSDSITFEVIGFVLALACSYTIFYRIARSALKRCGITAPDSAITKWITAFFWLATLGLIINVYGIRSESLPPGVETPDRVGYFAIFVVLVFLLLTYAVLRNWRQYKSDVARALRASDVLLDYLFSRAS